MGLRKRANFSKRYPVIEKKFLIIDCLSRYCHIFAPRKDIFLHKETTDCVYGIS